MSNDQRKALYIKDDLGNVIEVTEQDTAILSWGVLQTLLVDMISEGMKLAQQQQGQIQQPAQAQQVVVNVNIDHEKLADAIVRSLSTHALPQATPMMIESSTHRESGKWKAENEAENNSSASASVLTSQAQEKRKAEKFSTGIKMQQVIDYHDQYPERTQFEVAKHFRITTRTLRNYFKAAGVEWK